MLSENEMPYRGLTTVVVVEEEAAEKVCVVVVVVVGGGGYPDVYFDSKSYSQEIVRS